MKKPIILVVVTFFLISLIACESENGKAEKYCWNCGEGISSEIYYCGYCGASVKEKKIEATTNKAEKEETTYSTETTKSTEESIETPATIETQYVPEMQESFHTHSYSANVTAPSCIENGYTTYICACGDKYVDNQTEAIGHAYVKKTTEPTCTEKGYTTYVCFCGDQYTDEQIPARGHNYAKKIIHSTCFEKGYTEYICSCGEKYRDDYTDPMHTYVEFICTQCGGVDKEHAYEYLMNWIKNNGKRAGDNISYIVQENSSQKYTVSYSVKYDNLFVDCYMNSGSPTESYAMLILDNYFYGFSFYGDSIYGYVDAARYSSSKSLTYSSADCKTYTEERMLDMAKISVDLLIEILRNCLLTNDLPISLFDLGFKSY